MNKIISMIGMALILLVPAQVFATTTTSTSQAATDLKVFAIGVNYTVHELQMKASQTVNGQIVPASNFVIAPENVVQIRQGQHLMVFTSTNEPSRIEQVKITDVNNVVTDLVASPQRQGYSLQGITAGVYVLNVIVDSPTSSNNKDAYETVLVILAPDQPPFHDVTEITKIINSVSIQIKIVNKFDNGSGSGNKTKPAPVPPTNVSIPKIPEIPIPPNYTGPKPMLPICDENTPPGQECIDEGDPDDCEPGFIDRGFGCVLEDDVLKPEEGEEEIEEIEEEENGTTEEPEEEEEEESSSEDEDDSSSDEPLFGG